MKKLLLSLILASVCRVAQAAPINYIQSKSTGTQLGATIFVDTGTIRAFTCSTCAITRALFDSNLTAGTSGYVFQSRGATLGPQWLPTSSVSVGGSTKQIQYNNGGSLGGVPSFVTASSVTISTPTVILGTITNDSAAVGYYGEYVSTFVASVHAPSNGVVGDLASMTLTPGDWDVTAFANLSTAGTETVALIGISATSGNTFTGLTAGDTEARIDITTGTSSVRSLVVPAVRMSLSTSTILYFKMYTEYASGSPLFDGRMSARRVR